MKKGEIHKVERTSNSQFSPSAMWVLRNKFKSTKLDSTFPH